MIRKGTELFEIPPKLATDIRVYWVEQERKLLSPKKNDVSSKLKKKKYTPLLVQHDKGSQLIYDYS